MPNIFYDWKQRLSNQNVPIILMSYRYILILPLIKIGDNRR